MGSLTVETNQIPAAAHPAATAHLVAATAAAAVVPVPAVVAAPVAAAAVVVAVAHPPRQALPQKSHYQSEVKSNDRHRCETSQ